MIRALTRSVIQFVLRMPGLRLLALMGTYGSVLGLSLFFAYQLRFDFVVPDNIAQNMLSVCAITVAVQLVCLFLFHQFDGLLTYFSTPDLRRLLSACSSPRWLSARSVSLRASSLRRLGVSFSSTSFSVLPPSVRHGSHFAPCAISSTTRRVRRPERCGGSASSALVIAVQCWSKNYCAVHGSGSGRWHFLTTTIAAAAGFTVFH